MKKGVGGGGQRLRLVLYRRLVRNINFGLLMFPETQNPKPKGEHFIYGHPESEYFVYYKRILCF